MQRSARCDLEEGCTGRATLPGVATLMEIDGIAVEIEWDPDEDRFYGVAKVEGGYVSIHGRNPDELQAAFRDTLKAQQKALAEVS